MLASSFLLSTVVAPAEAPNPVEAARGVIQRVIPAAADRFVLLAIAADEGRDVFEIEIGRRQDPRGRFQRRGHRLGR